ncbi:MAG: hypothetical protein IPO87_19555 [Flavobacteriales bacterium]|nr:hypothetical protein [Flavobacteriales bacterium]
MKRRAVTLMNLLMLVMSSAGQTIDLGYDIKLTGEVVPFDSTAHAVTHCKVLDWQDDPICLIDGQPYFGSDLDYRMPRNHFRSLMIEISGKRTALDVTGMFNVSWDLSIHDGQFEIKPCEGGHILTGGFSDGAGVYTVTWKIVAGGAIRTELKRAEH